MKQKSQTRFCRKVSFCIVALFLTCFFINAHASGLKIGIVDIEKVLRESIPAVKAQKEIEQEFQSRDEEIQSMTHQVTLLQQKLEDENSALDESDRLNLERELANLSREYQRTHRQMREELSVRQNEEYSVILERANRVIKNIAETKQYDLILQKQDTVYRSQRIDITNQVIRALGNEQ